MAFAGCWSCGAHGPCNVEICECAKCVDPEGYDEWRTCNPEQYNDWLDSQHLNSDEYCDCPRCM